MGFSSFRIRIALVFSLPFMHNCLISVDECNRDQGEICVLMDDEESCVVFVDETELAVRRSNLPQWDYLVLKHVIIPHEMVRIKCTMSRKALNEQRK